MSMSMWLEMDDPFELLANAIGPPWEEELESSCRLRAATWQPVTGSEEWEHEVLHCARAPQESGLFPCFYVHRFSLRDGAATSLNAALLALARRELADTSRSESASNIGGHHSSRDLCEWPAVQAMGLPALLASALRLAADATTAGRVAVAAAEHTDADDDGTVDSLPMDAAARAEAGAAPDALRRTGEARNHHKSAVVGAGAAAAAEASDAAEAEGSDAAASLPHEAWLNCLGGGDWNVLHTHPGSSFSGCYYAADGTNGGGGAGGGGGGAGGDGNVDGDGARLYPTALLAGRLALLPTAPPRLSAEHTSMHIALRPQCPEGCASSSGELRGGSEGGFEYLLLEPRPGTCLVWPSFVPHFVLPVPMPPLDDGDAADGTRSTERLRVSVAFNR